MPRNESLSPLKPLLSAALLFLLPALALVFARDYLLFHTFAELFAVVVALVVFTIAWHTRNIASSDYLTFIGMASLPFAGVLIMHTLTYRGMPFLTEYGANLPTQLWLIARTTHASAFLIAPVFVVGHLRRPVNVLLAYAAVSGLLVVAALSGVFPAAFIEGQGLTPFKIWVEYAIIATLGLAALGLHLVREGFERQVRNMLYASMALTAVSELCFTLYSDPWGLSNRVGHVGHIAAFLFLYAALVNASLERPLATLFTKLKRREEELAEGYRVQHRIAETLQSAMTVQPQRIAGLEIAHSYRPAEGLGRIGGDFYDVYRVTDTRVAFLIGDVCGKGLMAAATTMKVRSALQAISLDQSDPAIVLEKVNAYLVKELDDDAFVTAVFGIIDMDSGRMRYAIAGHPDPIVCSSTAVSAAAAARAMPLGIAEPLAAVEHVVQLNAGDSVVLITDGVTDAKGRAERFGDRRVEQLLHEVSCGQSADAILAELIEALERHSGKAAQDDAAVLVLRYEPYSLGMPGSWIPDGAGAGGSAPAGGSEGTAGSSAETA